MYHRFIFTNLIPKAPWRIRLLQRDNLVIPIANTNYYFYDALQFIGQPRREIERRQ